MNKKLCPVTVCHQVSFWCFETDGHVTHIQTRTLQKLLVLVNVSTDLFYSFLFFFLVVFFPARGSINLLQNFLN